MTDARLVAQALETLSASDPDARLVAHALETLASLTPDARLVGHALEVLVPSLLVPPSSAFIGWGIPA